jgi:hypothetical protein
MERIICKKGMVCVGDSLCPCSAQESTEKLYEDVLAELKLSPKDAERMLYG